MSEKRLNLGCGDKLLPGYVNVDVAESRAGKSVVVSGWDWWSPWILIPYDGFMGKPFCVVLVSGE